MGAGGCGVGGLLALAVLGFLVALTAILYLVISAFDWR
jgi:hypothetical protein